MHNVHSKGFRGILIHMPTKHRPEYIRLDGQSKLTARFMAYMVSWTEHTIALKPNKPRTESARIESEHPCAVSNKLTVVAEHPSTAAYHPAYGVTDTIVRLTTHPGAFCGVDCMLSLLCAMSR